MRNSVIHLILKKGAPPQKRLICPTPFAATPFRRSQMTLALLQEVAMAMTMAIIQEVLH